MVGLFRAAAAQSRFIILAPDSRIAPNGQPSWEVPDRPGETSEDRRHIQGCVDEVLAMPGVRVDAARTLVAGHSGGASTAPYEASVEDLYSNPSTSGVSGRRPWDLAAPTAGLARGVAVK